jgi:hypothetical protein
MDGAALVGDLYCGAVDALHWQVHADLRWKGGIIPNAVESIDRIKLQIANKTCAGAKG